MPKDLSFFKAGSTGQEVVLLVAQSIAIKIGWQKRLLIQMKLEGLVRKSRQKRPVFWLKNQRRRCRLMK
ncbi:hypothetical protein FGO68_gene16666 [Halteria grandinella]|uniref:Uncharacterized protein n=1 Tax=Halteria grandinella TaxID=5974 RepID=A0A8J8TB54_HALGN|nr:hypothetical protein FGO68_gene16666 [Halteria grandinella]